MLKALKEKTKEALKSRPEKKTDILDIVEDAMDQINDEGSESLECERAIDALQNIIEGKD